MESKVQLKGDIEIGRRIRKIRVMRGLSQKQLADLVMVSASSITRLEKGQTMVSVFTMIEIAKVLQVSVAEILTGREGFEAAELAGVIAKLSKYPKEQRQAILQGFEKMLDGIFLE